MTPTPQPQDPFTFAVVFIAWTAACGLLALLVHVVDSWRARRQIEKSIRDNLARRRWKP